MSLVSVPRRWLTAFPVPHHFDASGLGRWSRSASTRVRILGLYTVILVLALVLGILLQRSILLSQLSREVDRQLVQEVEEIEALTAGRDPNTGEPFGPDVEAIFTTFLSRNIPVAGEALYTIVDGEPFASTVAPVQLLDDPEILALWAGVTHSTRGTLDTAAGEARYIATPLMFDSERSGVFVVAIFTQEKRDDVNRVLRVGGLVFGTTLLIGSAVAWVVAGRVLRPVRRLIDAARSIREDNWSERIPVHGNDELVELTNTFNEMLDRLEHSFGSQRQFIDDAGHELRTPITIMRGHLDLLDDDPAARAETLRLVDDELERMSRIVDDLLLLAKLQGRPFLEAAAIDFEGFTTELATKASALGERGWKVEEVARVVVVADRQRLTQAFMNLARNAVEHTHAATPVSLGSRVTGDNVLLWVRDRGPGITPEDQARIFERFARGSGVRASDGAGLGLAITQAIAEAHGGGVRLESAPGAGALFIIELPIDGPDRSAQ